MNLYKSLKKHDFLLSIKEFTSYIKVSLLNNPSKSNHIYDEYISSLYEGRLCFQSPIRPHIWKQILCDISKESLLKAILEVNQLRRKYNRMVKSLTKKKITFKGDPLGGSSSKVINSGQGQSWESYHQENDVKKIILLDLNRTYQEYELYHNETVKENITNSLSIWARENQNILYKQGMNEIFSVVFLSFYPYYHKSDIENSIEKILSSKKEELGKSIEQALEEYIEKNKENEGFFKEVYLFFHNENDIYADIYFIFDSIMNRGIKEMYDTSLLFNKQSSSSNLYEKNSLSFKQAELFQLQWKKEAINTLPSDEHIPLQKRCYEVISLKLKLLDPDLYDFFNQIELDCTVFLQRWVKCMFNRELELEKLIHFWDCIFANDVLENNEMLTEKLYNNFNMIDYLSVALILNLKDSCKFILL